MTTKSPLGSEDPCTLNTGTEDRLTVILPEPYTELEAREDLGVMLLKALKSLTGHDTDNLGVLLHVTLGVQTTLGCTIEDYDDHTGGGIGCSEHEVDIREMGDRLVCSVAAGFAERLLVAFPALTRDIPGEIEAEARVVVNVDEGSPHYRAGLERAAEIARDGR